MAEQRGSVLIELAPQALQARLDLDRRPIRLLEAPGGPADLQEAARLLVAQCLEGAAGKRREGVALLVQDGLDPVERRQETRQRRGGRGADHASPPWGWAASFAAMPMPPARTSWSAKCSASIDLWTLAAVPRPSTDRLSGIMV
jgi:hypothetical protein